MTIDERRELVLMMRGCGVREFTVDDMTVVFAEVSEETEPQHESPKSEVTRSRRSAGALVPREPSST